MTHTADPKATAERGRAAPADGDYLHFHLIGAGPDLALCDGRELEDGGYDPENHHRLPVCGTCWLLAQHIRRRA